MTDLTDAELDALEEKLGPRPRIATEWCCLTPEETDEVKQVIVEVWRWRALEAVTFRAPSRFASWKDSSVGSPGGASLEEGSA